MILLLTTLAAADPGSSLEAAYQREFAYLAAEKRALESRLEGLETSTSRRLAEADAELERLRDRHAALLVAADRAEERLGGVERAADLALQGSDLLDATLMQAHATLGDDDVDVPADLPARAALLNDAFQQSADHWTRGTTLQQVDGSFFLRNGKKVDGTLLHYGNIASWGVSAEGSGALVPVGADKLELWTEGAQTAETLSDRGQPEDLGIFLIEGRNKAVEQSPAKTLMSVVEAGGPVGLVIIALGLLGILLVGARVVLLSLANPTRQVLTDLKAHRHSGEVAEELAAEALLKASVNVERFGVAILVIAAVAPLLGLLGTVTGMIATFEIITEFGTGDPRMLSGGISEALVTTQLGLIVAIPTLLFGNLLTAWANRKLSAAEAAALNWVARREPEPLQMAGAAK